jgi:hypothetical protein
MAWIFAATHNILVLILWVDLSRQVKSSFIRWSCLVQDVGVLGIPCLKPLARGYYFLYARRLEFPNKRNTVVVNLSFPFCCLIRRTGRASLLSESAKRLCSCSLHWAPPPLTSCTVLPATADQYPEFLQPPALDHLLGKVPWRCWHKKTASENRLVSFERFRNAVRTYEKNTLLSSIHYPAAQHVQTDWMKWRELGRQTPNKFCRIYSVAKFCFNW